MKITIQEAIQRFETVGKIEPFVFLLPMSADLPSAEVALGLEFPPSYRVFIERDDCSSIPGRDIVQENQRSRTDKCGFYLPLFLVAFFHDGMGNQYCFDTRAKDADGEYPVIFWDHELSTDEKLGQITTTDRCFGEWLLRYAEELPEKSGKTAGTLILVGCALAFSILLFLAILGVTSVVKWFVK
jgi:hypothetical protein